MDVSQQGEEIPIRVDQKRLVPSLEQVTRPLVAAVEGLGVGRLQPMNHPRESNLPGLNRQMDMIRHQAVGDQAEFEPFAVMAQP